MNVYQIVTIRANANIGVFFRRQCKRPARIRYDFHIAGAHNGVRKCAGALHTAFSLFAPGGALLAFQYDHYTIIWEKRTPDTFENGAYNWDDLVNSTKINAAWKHSLNNNANLYIDGYAIATLLKMISGSTAR